MYRTTDRSNMYFSLQRRRGQDEEKSSLSFAGLLVATWDSVTESKVFFVKNNLLCILLVLS